MRTIHKYPFEIKDEVFIVMPEGANILCVQMQNGIPCIWADVESEMFFKQTRNFVIVGTGNLLPNFKKYIGTIQQEVFVWHVFEI